MADSEYTFSFKSGATWGFVQKKLVDIGGGFHAEAVSVLAPTGASSNTVQGPSAQNATAVGNPVPVGGVFLTPTTLTSGQRSEAVVDNQGRFIVMLGTSGGGASTLVSTRNDTTDGQANTGATSVGVINRGYVFNGSTWDRERKANLVGRLASSANSDNATLVKNAAGDVFSIHGYNGNAAVRYLKLYNKASSPTVGTDTPFMTLALAPTSIFTYTIPGGVYFSTGIGFGLVTGAADADNTSVGSGDILGLNIAYA